MKVKQLFNWFSKIYKWFGSQIKMIDILFPCNGSTGDLSNQIENKCNEDSLPITFDKQVFFFPVKAVIVTDVPGNNANITKKHIVLIHLKLFN